MKEILENHRARLTEAEKRVLWGTVRDELRRPRGFWARHRQSTFALAGAAAAILVTVVTLVGRGTNLETPSIEALPPDAGTQAPPAAGPADATVTKPEARRDGGDAERSNETRPLANAEGAAKKDAIPVEENSSLGAATATPAHERRMTPAAEAQADEIARRIDAVQSGAAAAGRVRDAAESVTSASVPAPPPSAISGVKDERRAVAGKVVGGVVGGVLGGTGDAVHPREKAQRLAQMDAPHGDGGRVRPEAGLRLLTPMEGSEQAPAVGGDNAVNGEPFDAMFFRHAGVNPFVDPREDPQATFAVDVDTAAYSLARAYLRRGELPPPEAIRVEEFVNALPHDYAPPRDRGGAGARGGKAFAIHLEAAPSPFGKDLVLLRVGLKGREIADRDRKPAVLTFVVDVSGSMQRENRLELVKRALHLLLDEMRPEDRVGLVVYGSDARVVLPHVSLRERARIERAIDGLVPEGSTNAAAGLRQGYALADEAFRAGWINKILLCSDGVANTGSTAAEEILARIGTEARRGIELSAIGFGMGNYNDVLMEKLADQGDGSYHYVDDLDEAQRVFVEGLTGTLQSIARQVKVQVAFDTDTVRRYRLLGYENRDVADRDFRNDRIDAGEVGAGHEVTALFEVSLEDAAPGEGLAEVRLRYEEPEGGRVVEMATAIGRDDVARRFDAGTPSFRLDAAVAEFAEILRGSYWAKDGSFAEVARVARSAAREENNPEAAQEFLRMVEKARRLWPGSTAPEGVEDDE
jgi:Ca-activated chloride channel family protein